MKKFLIRHSIFESNSSSSHSISIADSSKEFVLETIYPDQDGKIELAGGEFGWEWAKYNDAITKANYCAVDCMNDSEKMSILKEVIAEQTGAELVDILAQGDSYDKPNHSYIDHDSISVGKAAFVSKQTLKNFIFNKNSWLFTGNDNSTADPTFYDVTEFKGGRQIKVKYKFELKFDGYNKTTKFKEYPTENELNDAFNSILQEVRLYENGKFDDDNSIHAQMFRSRDKYFKYSSWKNKADFKNKIIYFIKEAYCDASEIWREKNPTSDWEKDKGYNHVKKIEDAWYAEKNPKYVKEVKYELVQIQ